MASTFLTRLRIGGKVVDAKAAGRLRPRRRRRWTLGLPAIAAAVVAVVAALCFTPVGGSSRHHVAAAWHRATTALPGSGSTSTNPTNQRLERSLTSARQQLDADQTFAAAVEPYAVRGRLTGRTIAVISAPGVTPAERPAVESTLTAAGAAVTADVMLSPAYLDPSQSPELDQLAGELGKSPNGDQTGNELLASVLSDRTGHTPPPSTRITTALAALSDGRFVAVSGQPRAAALAVVVTPSAPTGQTASELHDLVSDFHAAGDSAVLATSVGQAAGRVATVFALARAQR